MALASCPARHGQQRSLRRMRQALSWALARPPGTVAGRGHGWRPLRGGLAASPVRNADMGTGTGVVGVV
jgi:hypothetical protein